MKSLAIIGSGIAGMASAYFLRDYFNIQVLEKNDYIGGHTNTVSVKESEADIFIDTGFMVYNEITYPNLTRFFSKLNVETQPTSMTFSVQHIPSRLEFAGNDLNSLFAQRRRLFSIKYYKFLFEINRFNKECTEILDNPYYESHTLAQYLNEKKYSNEFTHQYLIPMSSAVWSTPPDKMLTFPASTLVTFFKNHGLLGFNTQHPWRTPSGGSRRYRDKIVALLPKSFITNRNVNRVKRLSNKVLVSDVSGNSQEFDYVIIATHADEALHMIESPSVEECKLLSPFKYQSNLASLHTDEAVMPQKKITWSSWNYRTDKNGNTSTIYWMNKLQNVSKLRNYFVSINDPDSINQNHILKQIKYTHPVFTVEALQAQKQLNLLNQKGPIYFCGSYFKYGFHEDALNSALEVSKILGATPWK
jgi:predicted NAD/FAD-binding protein